MENFGRSGIRTRDSWNQGLKLNHVSNLQENASAFTLTRTVLVQITLKFFQFNENHLRSLSS